MEAKVIGEPNLTRDEKGVIHNNDRDGYRSYMAQRQAALEALEQKQRIAELEKAVAFLLKKLEDKQ